MISQVCDEEMFDRYVRTLIDHNPDIQNLGAYLAHVLDDDQFNHVEPILLGIAEKLERNHS